MVSPPVIVWFRRDLRLADNPALTAACRSGAPVVPVYIHDPDAEAAWAPGAASRWWLHHSLASLDQALAEMGSRLTFLCGDTGDILATVIKSTGATAVHWNRCYEPALIERDTTLKATLKERGIAVESHNGNLLHEPWAIRNKSGSPFKVFTPYWRHCGALPVSAPLPIPASLPAPRRWPKGDSLAAAELLPIINWTGGMHDAWSPGSAGAESHLEMFLRDAFADYRSERDRPDRRGTSRLSPFLHFGEISPRQIWHAVEHHAGKHGIPEPLWRGSQFLAEVGWREFAYHLLYHFPHTPERALRPEFDNFAWRTNPDGLRAWQRGRTGYPIVDAGMRELWHTGWMHNRVRMIVASFLIKDLLIDWRDGAAWFWDTLVDADLAANTLGWQWTAGCGADAAPFFRIFNPVSQGEKFDPQGNYVRRWVPELKPLPDRWIHQPWNAPEHVLRGVAYPGPIVSHNIARHRALEAFQQIKKNAA